MRLHASAAPWPVRVRRLIPAAVAFALAASCHKMPLVAPSGSALTLVATPAVLAINGQADITAVVVEGAQSAGTANTPGSVLSGVGTPVQDGTVVTFTTTLGHIEPAEAETHGGKAMARLVADGRSGTATITAFSGGATNTLDVDIGAAAATHLAVTANPQELPATGGTSTIAVRVEDQQGNALPGIAVSFAASTGSVSPTTATSNDQGIASTTLTTTAESTVTATAGGTATSLTGTVTVTLRPRTTVSIGGPSSGTVGVPVSFTITPGATTIVTDVDVDFGDGSDDFNAGAISSATSASHVFTHSGTFTVTARAYDSQGGSTSVSTQVAIAPLLVSVVASPSSDTEPRVGDVVGFTATTTPGGALIDAYTWNFGDGTDPQTSQSFQVEHTYHSSGTKTVTACLTISGGGGDTACGIGSVVVKP
jgi:hypothetical protein